MSSTCHPHVIHMEICVMLAENSMGLFREGVGLCSFERQSLVACAPQVNQCYTQKPREAGALALELLIQLGLSWSLVQASSGIIIAAVSVHA